MREISRYRIEEKLGQGGMGVVFRATDLRLNRTVALKFLSAEEFERPEARHRFLREARAASTLTHSNIATIHDIEESGAQSFIAMEYVPGETLRERIKREPLSVNEALEYAAQIADALTEAHSKRIIHRDIKASNLIIKPNGQIKILDFGLAKLLPHPDQPEDDRSTITTLTQAGLVAGTLNYMSPEQLRGQELDARSDIFSLGVVLYEMLAGQRPFDRNSQAERISATLNDPPKPLRQFVPAIPPAVGRIIDRCLQKDPAQRYQAAADLRRDLLEAQARLAGSGTRSLATYVTGTKEKFQGLSQKLNAEATIITLLIIIALLLSYLLTEKFWPGRPAYLTEIKRVAVLPVRPLAQNNEAHQSLADSITETMVTALARAEPVTVLTARATERYRNYEHDAQTIGRELGVDGLIESSLQEHDGQLKITLSLVRCRDGVAVWRDEVKITEPNPFTTQEQVLTSLGQMLSGAQP